MSDSDTKKLDLVPEVPKDKTETEAPRPDPAPPSTTTTDMPPPASIGVIEKQQEAKLRAKYPGLGGPRSNPLLQKRLSKGQKYFDSGDYAMAKASKKPLPPGQKLLLGGGGTAHPTPESIPTRKTSLIHGLHPS